MHTLSRLLVSLCTFVLFISPAFSQQKLIDSLLLELPKAREDTHQVILLNNLVHAYQRKGEYANAFPYLDNTYELAVKLNYDAGLARNHSFKGMHHLNAGNYEIARDHFTQAIKLYDKCHDFINKAHNISNIGSTYNRQGNMAAALTKFREALKAHEVAGNKFGELIANNNIGSIYGNQGNYPAALNYFLEVVRLSKELGDKNITAIVLTNIANVYSYEDNIPEAMKFYEEALQLLQELERKNEIASVLAGMGVLYAKEKKYDKATAAFREALLTYEKLEDKRQIAAMHLQLGTVMNMTDQDAEALPLHMTSLKLHKELDDKISIGQSYVSIGRSLYKIGKRMNPPGNRNYYLQAIDSLALGLALVREAGYRATEKEAYKFLAEAHAALDDYEPALKYMNQYTQLQDSLLNNENTQKIQQLRTQYEVEKAISDEKVIREKLLAEEKFRSEQELARRNAQHDLILTEERINKVKAIEIEKLKFEFALAKDQAEQEKTIALQKAESEKALAEENARHQIAMTQEKASQEKEKADRQRKAEILFSVAGLLALISILYVLFQRQKSIKRKAVEKAETAHKMAELELQSLRAQLNPHFMFNSLNAIQELILMEDNDKSHTYLARFAKLLRTLLENANNPLISLAREKEFLELYLTLEKLRLPDLTYSFDIDPSIDVEHVQVPNMMLQPYIENAIWHGLSHKSNGNRHITIRILKSGHQLLYEVIDNGIGRQKASELKSLYRKEHRSKGMELLSKRFKLLSDEYKDSIETDVSDVMENGEVGGTRVAISVPVTMSKKTLVA